MSLTFATLVPGLLLIAVGAVLLFGSASSRIWIQSFPRSRSATYLLFGAATACFLYQVWHLPQADFGAYSTLLFLLFGGVAVLSFKYAPEFLAVRGLAALVLLGAAPLLSAAFMEYQYPQRLFMVSVVFLAIFAAIYLGAVPYRMRDYLDWLFRVPTRARTFGTLLCAYGLLLAVVAFTY